MPILPRAGSPGPEKKKEEQKKEKEQEETERNEEVQLLQGRCEDQASQLQALQAELKKTSMGLEVFVICTQHFCLKVFYFRPLKRNDLACDERAVIFNKITKRIEGSSNRPVSVYSQRRF